MTETSTSSNNACTYTRHFRSEISPFRHASRVPSSMRDGIGVLIVVTAAVRFSNALFSIFAIWCHSEKASTALSRVIVNSGHTAISLVARQPPLRRVDLLGRRTSHEPFANTVRSGPLTRAGRENVVHEPEFPKPQNNQAIDVDLVPGVRKVGVPRKPMMVVVQPFTEGEDRGHQLVGRAIIGLEATVTVAT